MAGMKSSDPRRGRDLARRVRAEGGRARQIVQNKGHTQCECLHTHTQAVRHTCLKHTYTRAGGEGGGRTLDGGKLSLPGRTKDLDLNKYQMSSAGR